MEGAKVRRAAQRMKPKPRSRDWLKWDGGLIFRCERCGQKVDGSMGQESISLRMAVAVMRAFAADHAKCKKGG